MKLVLAVLAAISFQASAFSLNIPSASDYPAESGWSVAMISMACGMDLLSVEGIYGTMERVNGGVVYRAYVNGQVYAAASATDSTIFAYKMCLK